MPAAGIPLPSRTSRALDAALVILPAVVIALHPLANNDLPMHLAIGEWVLETGIPSEDPFSLLSGGRPWVPHEWLAGVIFALLDRTGGAVAMVLAAAAGSALLALAHRGTCALLGVTILPHLAWSIPLWLMAGRRLMLRPHLFAWILCFLLWWVLLGSRRHPRLLWWVPLLLVAWVNLHGSFLLGIGIVGLDLIVCGRGHPLPWRQRLIITALAAGTLLTQVHVYSQPDLLAGVRHALGLVGDPVFMQRIQEWIPPFSSPEYRSTVAFWMSIPWIGAVVYGAVRGVGRQQAIPVSYQVFVLITLLLYLRHQRFVALFVLASLPLLPGLTRAGKALARRALRGWIVRGAVVGASLLLIFPGYPVTLHQAPRRPGLRWAANLPFDAIDALTIWKVEGGVLCEYDYGGLLAWKGPGRLRPTMDSRNSVHGAERFLRHQEALESNTPFRRALLAEVNAVVVRNTRSDLVDQLESDPGWTLVQVGRGHVVFIRSR